jgi:hypothetical protein
MCLCSEDPFRDERPRRLTALDEVLTPDEIEALGHSTLTTESGVRSVVQVARAWAWEVSRLEPDAPQPFKGADDYSGAQSMRAILGRSLPNVPEHLVEKLHSWLDPVDDRFRELTEPDRWGLQVRMDHDTGSEGWWWNRIPREGNVREEFDTYLPE